MIDVARIERLARRARFRIGRGGAAGSAGCRASVTRGQGLSFAGHREYLYGDDVRHVDWRVTARLARPFVKVFEQERAGTVMVLFDVSASMTAGAPGTRSGMPSEVAAFMVFLAAQAGERVGAWLFSDCIERAIPPRRGRGHAVALVHAITSHTARSNRTSIGHALEAAIRTAPRRAGIVMVSDFLDSGYEEPLRRAAARHDVTALRLPPPERPLPARGLIRVSDPETGRSRWIDAGSTAVRAAIAASRQRLAEERRACFAAAGVPLVEIGDGPWIATLLRAFDERLACV
jgi:uncharacterized protein (DUF58 family)